MKYYVAERTILKSPKRTYFLSIDEINDYYNIDTDESDYGCGYTFIQDGKSYLLGKEE